MISKELDELDANGREEVVAAAAVVVKASDVFKFADSKHRKLPGFGTLVECCTVENSSLSQTAAFDGGVKVLPITKEMNILSRERDLIRKIKKKPDTSIHGSLPCTS